MRGRTLLRKSSEKTFLRISNFKEVFVIPCRDKIDYTSPFERFSEVDFWSIEKMCSGGPGYLLTQNGDFHVDIERDILPGQTLVRYGMRNLF